MKIEKNIPIHGESKYAFVREMEIGDSVYFDDLEEARRGLDGMRSTRGLPGRRYMYRKQDAGGARIWRIE
ncbi:MAG: hypothetical protein QGG48_06840 [Desulfatiglandales bacterium]|jgi:hypothetical protein|nr:hypothetical protein [Desulfatiglandales bacterium]|tara:strand:- start:295 stop:504 length:210 start_codon:yes stop_codon:yes gene_type:complete